MRIYCKKCKKYTANTFPKKLVLISKSKIKGKSRWAICLTGRFFIDEMQYDLENALEIYLQFLLIDIINMKTYCVKCKKDTENIDPNIFKTKNNKLCNQNVVFVKIKSHNLLKNKMQKVYWVIQE